MKFGRPEKVVVSKTLPISEGLDQFLGCDSFIKKTWGGWGRALLGSSVMVFFALIILLTSILSGSNPMRVQPHEIGLNAASNAASNAPSNAASNAADAAGAADATGAADLTVQYYLPYPGVLPDNPLYKLKAGRDKVVLWLTFDSLEKAKKELLYADKRINAAGILIDGGKSSIGVSTATKAEKYLGSSVEKILTLRNEGKDVKSMILTLEKAIAKHHELMHRMEEKLNGQEKIVLEKTRLDTEMQLQKVQQVLVEEF